MKLCMFLRQTEVTTNREIKRNVDNSQLYRALFNSLLQLISLDDRIFVCDFFSGYWSIVVIYCIVYAGLSNPIDFIGIYCHIDNGKKVSLWWQTSIYSYDNLSNTNKYIYSIHYEMQTIPIYFFTNNREQENGQKLRCAKFQTINLLISIWFVIELNIYIHSIWNQITIPSKWMIYVCQCRKCERFDKYNKSWFPFLPHLCLTSKTLQKMYIFTSSDFLL